MERRPSPWPYKEPLKEEHAFTSTAFPVNSLPFINRLKEVLDEAGTNSLQSLGGRKPGGDESFWKARALLWIINGQYFGQATEIDMSKEWDELNRAHKEGLF